jgi:hypothetical protein
MSKISRIITKYTRIIWAPSYRGSGGGGFGTFGGFGSGGREGSGGSDGTGGLGGILLGMIFTSKSLVYSTTKGTVSARTGHILAPEAYFGSLRRAMYLPAGATNVPWSASRFPYRT